MGTRNAGCLAVVALIGAFTSPASEAQIRDRNLWSAIARSELGSIHEYLNAGGDPNVNAARPLSTPGEAPWPLIKIALTDRQEDIALALLQAGADFDAAAMPLGTVAGNGMPRVLKYLIDQDPGRLRNTPQQGALLQPPIEFGYHQSVEVILSEARRLGFSWDPAATSEAAVLAIDDRHYNIARALYAAGTPLKDSAIRVAARNGSPGMVRYLLSLGADPDAPLAEEFVNPQLGARTAMDYAWLRYRFSDGIEREIARMNMFELLRGGATAKDGEPEDVPRDGLSELDAIVDLDKRLVEAARFGFYDVAESIVRNGGLSQAALREATTMSLESRNNDIAVLLIEAGAPLSGGPLHAAASGNSPGIVRDLIARGADPNEIVDGATPIERWWARVQMQNFGAAGDFVLHELLKASAEACWLLKYIDDLNLAARGFMTQTAQRCSPTAVR